MTEKNKGKKLLTWTLALSMTLALPPVGVFAEDGAGGEGSQQTNIASATEQPDGSSNGSGTANNEGNKLASTSEEGGQTNDPAPSLGTTGAPASSGEEKKGENETLTPLPTPVSGGEAEEGKDNTTPSEGKDENKDESKGETTGEVVTYAATIDGKEGTYETLQAAIDAAENGETVVLAKDVTENININKSITLDLKGKTLTGFGDDSVVTITGAETNVTITSSAEEKGKITGGNNLSNGGGFSIQDATVNLHNLSITENKAIGIGGAGSECTGGGGIYAKDANLTLDNVHVYENTADLEEHEAADGGGILSIGGALTIKNNSVIENNTAIDDGGGICASNTLVNIEASVIQDNHSLYGGGLYVTGKNSCTITQNTRIQNNRAEYMTSKQKETEFMVPIGGGIYCGDGLDLTIQNSTVALNIGGDQGGGIYGVTSNIILAEDNALYNNAAQTAGDDLFTFGANSMISLADATKMSGDRKLASDGEKITGWFYDGYKDGRCSRWGAETEDGQKYFDAYVTDETAPTQFGLKAAHEQLYKVTVHYAYSDGTKAAEAAVINVKAGAAYSIDSPAIEGYKADKATVSGTIPADKPADTVITVTYTKESSGGGGGGGGHRPKPKPTVEIPDDDALGLNNTDHFAYIVGYGNSEVQPQNSITRAEVAAIFFRLLEDGIRSENFTHQNDFSDVAADAWYCSSVSTLSRMGIIAGYPDGTFRPNAPITRAEFAAIATRFDNNGDKTPVSFTDIIGHWAEGEITVAANHGWVSGYGDDTFRPQNQITRAETMSLVNRVLKRLPATPADLLPDMITWTDNADTSSWYYLPVQEATNSHYYEFKENSKHEKWTELRETRDWSKLG